MIHPECEVSVAGCQQQPGGEAAGGRSPTSRTLQTLYFIP
jgi:hypothetical protein